MKVDISYYNTYNDMYMKKNKQHSHYNCVTAFRHNKDCLRLYFYDKILFDSDKARIYIDTVKFNY